MRRMISLMNQYTRSAIQNAEITWREGPGQEILLFNSEEIGNRFIYNSIWTPTVEDWNNSEFGEWSINVVPNTRLSFEVEITPEFYEAYGEPGVLIYITGQGLKFNKPDDDNVDCSDVEGRYSSSRSVLVINGAGRYSIDVKADAIGNFEYSISKNATPKHIQRTVHLTEPNSIVSLLDIKLQHNTIYAMSFYDRIHDHTSAAILVYQNEDADSESSNFTCYDTNYNRQNASAYNDTGAIYIELDNGEFSAGDYDIEFRKIA